MVVVLSAFEVLSTFVGLSAFVVLSAFAVLSAFVVLPVVVPAGCRLSPLAPAEGPARGPECPCSGPLGLCCGSGIMRTTVIIH